MFYFDPMYFVFIGPALLLAMWAQWKVKHAYNQASQMPARSGVSGAEAADNIMRAAGITNVSVEMSQGFLSDHYDPRNKVLRLSPDVYEGRSLAALGIAAHEAGHAIQDAKRYGPLAIRNGLVPMASTGSWLSMIFLMIGMFMMYGAQEPSTTGQVFALIGIGAFGLTVVFQLVNLPVEFDASNRAKAVLAEMGMVGPDEMPAVRSVLSAAAMTYVAATLQAVLQMLYFVWLFFGRRE